MRRSVLSLPAVVLLVVAILGSSARPSQAQGVLDAIKKKAQEAKKAADEIKRKADSTSLAVAKTKAAAESADDFDE